MGRRFYDFIALLLLAGFIALCYNRTAVAVAKERTPIIGIEDAVNRSQWQRASEMLREEVVAGRGPEIDFKIRQIASNLHHQADNLVRLLDRDYALGHYARVTPAVQWAQNSTHVFINIKYSHRWNSPGALHVTNPSVAVSPCCFNFSATGEHSGVVKRYVLSFRLAHDVVPYEEDDQSWWTQSSVGRMSVTLEKAERNFRWRQLVFEPKKQISLGSVGPWLDLGERYAEEVSTLPYHDGYQKSKPTQSVLAASRQERVEKSSTVEEVARFARARLTPRFIRVYMPKSSDAPWVVLVLSGMLWTAVMMVVITVLKKASYRPLFSEKRE